MTGTSGSLHNESPIIKSSIPVSKAVEMVRQQRNTIKNTNLHNTNCTSSINTSDSLSDLEILQQNSSVDNHILHHPYGTHNHYRYQYSSNDADEDDEDLSSHGSHDILKKNNDQSDNTSLLNDVLAVMSLPKYSNLPGNQGSSGFKSGESTTSAGGNNKNKFFKQSSDDFHSYSSKNNDSEYRSFLAKGERVFR